jgi:hypothetical protein
MGNWGIHVLDDVRNVVYQDAVSAPHSLFTMGGHVVWDDAGETPNVHYGCFLTDSFPTYVALSNLPASPERPKSSWASKGNRPQGGPGSGYVVVCEGGYLLGQRGSAKAIDLQGKTLREFRGGDMMRLHVENFLHAVRERNAELLNADVEVGHHSTTWCNLANVAFRATTHYSEPLPFAEGGMQGWDSLLQELTSQLQPFGLNPQDLHTSGLLRFDVATNQFQGQLADSANGYLRREPRAAFSFPQVG